VDNVVAIGNSAGFVEPLEATALMTVCSHSRDLTDFLIAANLMPSPAIRDLFNKNALASWLEIRDFLAMHYKFNTRLDTPFWKHCQNDTDVSHIADLLEFYSDYGPTRLCRHFLEHRQSNFGLEGFLVMLVGNKVPYRNKPSIPAGERNIWEAYRSRVRAAANLALTSEEALAAIRRPEWVWSDEAR
jgi:tryptophan halogenase